MKIKKMFKNIKNKLKKAYDKNITHNKTKFNIKETILFMTITLVFGLFIGGILMYGKGNFNNNSLLHEFASTYNEILDSYYENVDKDKLLESGISGMMKYLNDPYTTFMSKETALIFNDEVEGIYHGIGAEITYNDSENTVSVGKVFDDSPAFKAGLKEKDIILKVNGTDITGKSLEEIASMVKGEDNTKVSITVLRDSDEIELSITRGPVDNISVIADVLTVDDKKIGYLNISTFANNTYKQFKKELENLEKDNINSLIIDVRGNSGGYLTTVTDIISLFIEKDEVIYQLKMKDNTSIIRDRTSEKREYPIVVLVDHNSASASEVLAGALQEAYHATVVGTKTFGKGKVQKVRTLSNGALIKYTYQEWLTPKGNYIDGTGITPDEVIEYAYNVETGEENQLTRALEILK